MEIETNEDDTTGLFIRFAYQRERNAHRSVVEGREVYDDVEIVSIRMPGSKDEIVNIVTDEHRRRFKTMYNRWKANEAAPVTGTPLEEWPAASTSMIDELKSYGIRSVEQLAEISDGIAMQQQGWMTLRTRAQAFLENAKSNAVAESLAVQNQALQDQLAAMQRQIDQLTAPPQVSAAKAAK